MPDLTIVMTTYFPTDDYTGMMRMDAAIAAVRSWIDGLFIDGGMHIVIADDGSAAGRLEEFGYMLSRYTSGDWDNISTPRLGCAGALRAGAARAEVLYPGSPIFYAQDDWELQRPLSVAESIDLIEDDVADIVRLGPTHPNLSAQVVRTAYDGDAEWCLQYDWRGGGYVVGWRPAIYRSDLLVRSLEHVPDGLAAIEGERIWLENFARMRDLPRVFHAPNATLAGPFRHIDTVELGEDEPDTLTERYRG